MTSRARQLFTERLWDQYLEGGVSLSEYSTFLAQDADTAFVNQADLATIIVCCAAIESHLRYEGSGDERLVSLISETPMEEDLREKLHDLRRFRNQWTHVSRPELDERLLAEEQAVRDELSEKAHLAMECLIRVLCGWQWV